VQLDGSIDFRLPGLNPAGTADYQVRLTYIFTTDQPLPITLSYSSAEVAGLFDAQNGVAHYGVGDALAGGSDQGAGTIQYTAMPGGEYAIVYGLSIQLISGASIDQNGRLSWTVGSDSSAVTPSGTNVTAQPADPATGAAPVSLTFANVTQGGTTSLAISGQGQPPPPALNLAALQPFTT
jgi:hypothetical protein